MILIESDTTFQHEDRSKFGLSQLLEPILKIFLVILLNFSFTLQVIRSSPPRAPRYHYEVETSGKMGTINDRKTCLFS